MTDPSTDPKRFDPRFDPAFQPGYDARNDPSIAARSDPARAVAPAPLPLRPDPVGSPPERTPAAQHRAPVPEPTIDPTSTPGNDRVEADDTTTRGTNPFVIALWAVSVLLIAGGIAVFRAIPGLDQQSTGAGTSAFVQLFGYAVLAAVLIGGGVLVAAGNLFLLAARWRPRSNERED